MGEASDQNEETIRIDRLAVGGDGVGRLHGKVTFVPGALPGELLRIRRRDERARYVRAEPIELLEASALRRPSDCPHELEDGCGGCGFRHVADERALEAKLDPVLGEMAKIASEVDWPVPDMHPEGQPDGSRSRVRFHLVGGVLGLFRRGTHEPVAIPSCRAAHPDIIAVADRIQRVVRSVPDRRLPGTVLIERTEGGVYGHWPASPEPEVRRRLSALVEGGAVRGFRFAGAAGADLGETWMVERAQVAGVGLEYHRRVGTFGQANPGANAAIRDALDARLREVGPARVLDLYAGSGNLSLVAALSAPRVEAVEWDLDALDGIARSARRSGLDGVTVRRRDLRRGLSARIKADRPDAVVLDPPRSGAAAVMNDLVDLAPVDIFYVACSPTHLARDACALAGRYEVVRLDAFDMFPRTPHVELLAHFRIAS